LDVESALQQLVREGLVHVLDALNGHRAGGYLTRAQAGQSAIDGAGDEILIRAEDGTVTGFRLLPAT
jgi:hypothetical protein